MFSTISWQQYCIFLLIANAIYYLFIWIVFYEAKLPVLSGVVNFRKMSLHGEDQPDEIMTTAQHVIAELRPLFNGKTNKNELLFALKAPLKKYADWEESGFRDLINQFVAAESETICSIRLRDDDLRALWT
jgi:hypothetical protein